MNEFRTHNCGELREKNVGEHVKIAGWIQTTRDLGGVVFIDVRDQYGITQAVISGNDELVDFASKVPNESTVSIEGTVRLRDAETINENIETGKIEIFIEKIEVLGKRFRNLPFEINDETKEVREDLRLQYRYLDLRNDRLKNNLILRANILQFLRSQMIEQGFLEVQTPVLTSSSPEGARDYLVPSRVHKGKFYALPQAPQQFKQLLMVSGIDKYFQIAPCFRDMEMAFSTQEDVFNVIEPVMYNTFTKFSEKKVAEYPFPRIPYREAMEKYGSDKPDLRNPLIIEDVTDIFQNIEFNAFKGKIVKTITTHNMKETPRRFFDGITDFAVSECGAKGLAWLRVNEDGTLQGPIAKFIDEEHTKELLERTNTNIGDAIFFIAEKNVIVQKLAGQIRTELGNRLDLIEKDVFKFCWIVDFPMYELNDDGKIDFCHNPFSMPQGGLKAIEEKEPLDILAYQYDIVCNGIELSSGAVRNHDPEIMIKAFEVCGYTKEHIEKKFSALFNAFHYGAPPHAGIAPGVDRMIMLLTDAPSLREVIAFPMNSKAQDLLMGAPGEVTEEQLREVHIKLR